LEKVSFVIFFEHEVVRKIYGIIKTKIMRDGLASFNFIKIKRRPFIISSMGQVKILMIISSKSSRWVIRK